MAVPRARPQQLRPRKTTFRGHQQLLQVQRSVSQVLVVTASDPNPNVTIGHTYLIIFEIKNAIPILPPFTLP